MVRIMICDELPTDIEAWWEVLIQSRERYLYQYVGNLARQGFYEFKANIFKTCILMLPNERVGDCHYIYYEISPFSFRYKDRREEYGVEVTAHLEYQWNDEMHKYRRLFFNASLTEPSHDHMLSWGKEGF